MSFFTGTPERFEQRSLLAPEQQPLYRQMIASGQGMGAGGAFGDVADYYRGNLSNNPQDFQSFAAPEMRRFNEQIIPGLAEQFAGMGSGGSGLSGSGFRNAAVGAGADLSERLAAIRANLRQQSAQGLMGIGQQGLQQYSQNFFRPATEGFFGKNLGNLFGHAGGAFAGQVGADAGKGFAKLISGLFGSSSPYGDLTKPGDQYGDSSSGLSYNPYSGQFG